MFTWTDSRWLSGLESWHHTLEIAGDLKTERLFMNTETITLFK